MDRLVASILMGCYTLNCVAPFPPTHRYWSGYLGAPASSVNNKYYNALRNINFVIEHIVEIMLDYHSIKYTSQVLVVANKTHLRSLIIT